MFPTALVEDDGQKDDLRFVADVEAAERVTVPNESSESKSANDGDAKGQHIPRRESMTSEELLGEAAAELHPHGDEFDEIQVLDITEGLDEVLETTKPAVEKGRGRDKGKSLRFSGGFVEW